MSRGFYTLGSGMITQSRVMNTIANNMNNVSTPGFKKDSILTSTFGEMVLNRVDQNKTAIGNSSFIRTATESATIHSQGILQSSERNLDFAIADSGFFCVQTDEGPVYTRNGSFNLDDDGYLVVPNYGRVLGENGPIQIYTDHIEADSSGNIYLDGNIADRIAVYDFENYDTLTKVGEGVYVSTDGAATLKENPDIRWRTIEGSNVDTAEEMSNAIEAQRSLQSYAQALKIFDQNMAKAVELGRL